MRKRREKKPKKKDLGKVVAEALDNLTFLWREAVRVPRMRAIVALFALVLVVSMLVARQGTTVTRVGAIALLVGSSIAVAALAWRERRTWDDPSLVIERLAGRAMPEQAKKAQRAIALLDEDGEPKEDGTSPALTRMFVARALAAIPNDRIAEAAGRTARRFHLGALGIALATIVAFGTNPWGVIEGFDVLIAHKGEAPFGMRWLEGPKLTARPPDYLHQDERVVRIYGEVSLPRGTVITFRGAQEHAGRRLLLTDGQSEVPFVDDGAGQVVARWPIEGDCELRVLARFGDVRIADSEATSIKSIADKVPIVTLEGAPMQLHLAQMAEDVPIKYEATDDHGLREVDLVLKSGPREERRVLAKLDGETRNDRGGNLLKPTDAFFRKSHGAIEITVEAKDNDPITGPKWGASAPITVLPPDIAEPAAQRMAALRALRDAYVDSLATVVGNDLPTDAQKRLTLLDEERTQHGKNAALLQDTLSRSFAGVRINARLRALLNAEATKVGAAMSTERERPTTATHAALIKAEETMVLVVDGVIRGLGFKDTKEAAKLLADVADDLSLGAMQMQHTSETERGKLRFLAATTVLRGGEKQLVQLGSLGRDLGGAIHAGLARTDRANGSGDLFHAELAARDLAARLHQPDPSFGTKGGGGGHATGESGGQSGEGDPSAMSEAERAQAEAAQEVEDLAQDHAGAMNDVEQALKNAQSQEDLDKLKAEAKEHAKTVREAAKSLPSIGGGSDSWTSKASSARELAEQMARSLEDGNPADAVQSGKNAIAAIDEAKRVAARERYYDDGARDADKRLEDTKKKLEPEVKWAEDQLAEMQKRAAQRAQQDLQKTGDREDKLGERAGKLGDKERDLGADQAANDLDDAQQLAREAAKALQRGDVDTAEKKQRDAQRKLEAAKQALGQDDQEDESPSGPPGQNEGNDNKNDGHVQISKAGDHKGPEDFRRRVIKGLAQPGSAREKEAIKRYAEGLLR